MQEVTRHSGNDVSDRVPAMTVCHYHDYITNTSHYYEFRLLHSFMQCVLHTIYRMERHNLNHAVMSPDHHYIRR